MKILSENEVKFCKISAFDDAGKVFFYNNRVFRAIYNEKTAIFEWTSKMLWLAAKSMIKINQKLGQHGYLLKDSHPWNIMFHLGYPIFIDFGSLIESTFFSSAWIDEFIRYFGVSLLLSNSLFHELSIEYRREHTMGIGINFFDNKLIKILFFNSFKNSLKSINNIDKFLYKVDQWIDNHKPVLPKKEYWNDYNQIHKSMNPLKPTEEKQIFVYEKLTQIKPSTVLDCATNKGYYAEMAATLGASVVAFDYEEFCVDQCLHIAQNKKLNITPVIMNFKLPTPNYGIGLLGDNAFFRFRSDIVLALGIIHHMCISQNLPVNIFCDICSNYALKGLILEFVEPEDIHVSKWNLPTPSNYSCDYICQYLTVKFPFHEIKEINKDGVQRKLIYFHN
jgi:hypothetical protein